MIWIPVKINPVDVNGKQDSRLTQTVRTLLESGKMSIDFLEAIFQSSVLSAC